MRAPGRRAFLRSLASLPLIGGGVALIGNPTAAAVPITDALLRRYRDFLAADLRETMITLHERDWVDFPQQCPGLRPQWNRTFDGLVPGLPHCSQQDAMMARAAVVLSTAGMPLS